MATVDPNEMQANLPMCLYCFQVLERALHRLPAPSNPTWLTAQAKVQIPLFVTWDVLDARYGGDGYRLRGCIGTLTPKPFGQALGEYSLIAALKDHRFRPIALSELESLKVSVSLLIHYETCKDAFDWEVGVHGIWIQFMADDGRGYSATYLPQVASEQGWTIPETLDSLIKKAGYKGRVTSALLSAIQCTRFQSSKFSCTYQEYVDAVPESERLSGGVSTGVGAGTASKKNSSCNSM
eukprot:Nitzschia sp. Nitz4//scaffold66_size103028//1802//2515//NITZ4_004487-RA/size103028-processed-gene-0.20-mRNA-1//-1//CDS//3329556317//1310//frame0